MIRYNISTVWHSGKGETTESAWRDAWLPGVGRECAGDE